MTLSTKQAKRLLEAYIISTFKFSALILISNVHKRTLLFVYLMEDAGFEDLLQKDKYIAIHTSNRQNLTNEVFKLLNHFSLPLLCDLLERKSEQP